MFNLKLKNHNDWRPDCWQVLHSRSTTKFILSTERTAWAHRSRWSKTLFRKCAHVQSHCWLSQKFIAIDQKIENRLQFGRLKISKFHSYGMNIQQTKNMWLNRATENTFLELLKGFRQFLSSNRNETKKTVFGSYNCFEQVITKLWL